MEGSGGSGQAGSEMWGIGLLPGVAFVVDGTIIQETERLSANGHSALDRLLGNNAPTPPQWTCEGKSREFAKPQESGC